MEQDFSQAVKARQGLGGQSCTPQTCTVLYVSCLSVWLGRMKGEGKALQSAGRHWGWGMVERAEEGPEEGLGSQEERLDRAWQRQHSGKWSLAEDCGIFQGEGDLEVLLEVWWCVPRLGVGGE